MASCRSLRVPVSLGCAPTTIRQALRRWYRFLWVVQLKDLPAVIGSPSSNTICTMDAIQHSWPNRVRVFNNRIKGAAAMKVKSMLISVGITVALAVLATGAAISAQDRYTLKVPNGLAFSEFKGYEGWQTISISHNGEMLAVILGNTAMFDAYQAGVP